MGSQVTSPEIATLLREHGLRATPQRLAICGQLLARPCHYSAQGLYEVLGERFPSLSPNTVYLTLAQLESAGLVRRLHVRGQAVFDSNTGVHDHLCCERCGQLTDLPVPAERRRSRRRVAGWHILGEARTLFGLCPACRDRATG